MAIARWVLLGTGLLAGAGLTSAQGKPTTITLGPALATVGAATGRSETLLSGVRGAIRVDGKLVVLDATSQRVLFFDSSGKYVKTVGRDGEGPGEFGHPIWMGRCQDGTLLVYDARLRRSTRFSASGMLLETFARPAAVSTGDLPLWCGPAEHSFLLSSMPQEIKAGGKFSVPALVLKVRRLKVDTIGEAGSQDYFQGTRSPMFSEVPLGRAPLAAMGRVIGVVCTNHDGACTVFDTAGKTLATWTAPVPTGLAVQAADWKKALDQRLEQESRLNLRPYLRQTLSEIPQPGTFPALAAVAVDGLDRVWVSTFEGYSSATARWLVLDPRRGQILATASLPSDLRVMEIGADYIVGVRRDEDGAERVTLHTLVP
jgi:hypothetical protein